MITPAGNVTSLHDFGQGNDGSFPQSGLTLGTDGNLYGTTSGGGSSVSGTVFTMSPSGNVTILYNFSRGSDGGGPYAPPVEGNDGNFYGVAVLGGKSGNGCGECGTIYKITPSGTFTLLYQFDGTTGNSPYALLVLGTDGNFYGTTKYGATCNCGVVFKITPAGKFTVLHAFDNTDGGFPVSPLIQGTDGNFYGTTQGGGSNASGVVFKMTPAGKLTVLHNMNGTRDGAQPYGGLVQASDGSFYGTNAYGGNSVCAGGCGTLFKITPAGSYSVLYAFDATTGATPETTPFQHTSGVVYGDTLAGGTGNVNPCTAGNCGVFYSWSNASLPAFVTLLPYSGKVGKTIEFLGQGFIKGNTTVSFNGVTATANVVSGTYLTAAVPKGTTTGPVTVTTSGAKLTSKVFRVTPQVLTFTPTSGPVGTQVTVTGVSLTQTMNVTFGGVAATTFTVTSDGQLTASVPIGAVTGHIAITTKGGTAVSSDTFTITP